MLIFRADSITILFQQGKSGKVACFALKSSFSSDSIRELIGIKQGGKTICKSSFRPLRGGDGGELNSSYSYLGLL